MVWVWAGYWSLGIGGEQLHCPLVGSLGLCYSLLFTYLFIVFIIIISFNY